MLVFKEKMNPSAPWESFLLQHSQRCSHCVTEESTYPQGCTGFAAWLWHRPVHSSFLLDITSHKRSVMEARTGGSGQTVGNWETCFNAIEDLWSQRAVSWPSNQVVKHWNVAFPACLKHRERPGINHCPACLCCCLLHSLPGLGWEMLHAGGPSSRVGMLAPTLGLPANGHALISAGVCDADAGAQCMSGAAPGEGRGDLRAES